jgi:hypothetical protein
MPPIIAEGVLAYPPKFKPEMVTKLLPEFGALGEI